MNIESYGKGIITCLKCNKDYETNEEGFKCPNCNKKEIIKLKENVDIPKEKITLEKLSFEIITNVYLNNSGEKRFAKRKVIFLNDLNKYFEVKLKDERN